MTTIVTLHAGHDVAYFTRGQGHGGCTGAMSYYTDAKGEPPGQWAGRGAQALGLNGVVGPAVIHRLYQQDISPDGEFLGKRRQSKKAREREAAAVAAHLETHPYASAIELAEVRAGARSKEANRVPYFDFTVSAVKSVSVLHVSYRVAARKARDEGNQDLAGQLDAKANDIENALMEAAREAVGWLEREATYTRTGHHSGQTGEWRDGQGLVAAMYLHHLSRDGDPQLHVHIAVLNRVQRADRADSKWRTLDSRTFHQQRLGAAPVPDRSMEAKLAGLGYVMVPRLDGNGMEVGGVEQAVMDLFSSRRVAITQQVGQLAAEWEAVHGKPPDQRTLWLLRQEAGQRTRKSKAEAQRTVAGKTGSTEPTEAERLAAWEKQTAQHEVQVLSAVHEAAARFAEERSSRAIPVLDDAAKACAARIAVAEVQKHHAVWTMAQLRFEVHRALPAMAATADTASLITEVAKLAVSGRAGTEVVRVSAGDITDVSPLGVRASDGGSIFRPPHDERWTTLDHLDVEGSILDNAKRKVLQLVTERQARAAVAETDLNAEQAEAVVMMLTAATSMTALVAPAGSGKSHTMAAFARTWTRLTGRRVIGLTTSTNAARVLQGEGLAESYNIAEFLGKIKGSAKLRRPIPLHENDVLVLDEASQLGTADLALVEQAARVAGARLIPVGDTQQLGAVEAGGMFRLLAQEVPAAELHEVRRFNAGWEAEASVKLREGDFSGYAEYDTHGRMRGADQETAMDRAAGGWLTQHLRGKNVLLLAGSNEEAAELSRRVQSRLIELGAVGDPKVSLSDGNRGGTGDLIRARLNTTINAGGRELSNRDTLRIVSFRSREVMVRRRELDGTWTDPFPVPRPYLAKSAELDYAGNTHVGQGRTVDAGILYVSDSLSKQGFYVGMSRGRDSNTAEIVTGNTAPPGHEPFEQATPESVIKSVMQRDEADLSATEQIRLAQEWSGGTGHMLNLWREASLRTLTPAINEAIKARLTPAEYARYEREFSKPVLQQALRERQLAGQDLGKLIQQITSNPMDGARSISSVLHGRLGQIAAPEQASVTWAQRTPEDAPELAKEQAAGLDDRRRALGERMAEMPEPWLAKHLGMLAPDASMALREDYAQRGGAAAAYREAAGITDPEQAVSAYPHRENPELEVLRKGAMRALDIRDEQEMVRSLSRGQLDAEVLDAERAQANAPADVSQQLRLTAQAEADARQQAADAQIRHEAQEAAGAEALARTMAAEKTRLEVMHSTYQSWSESTAATRGTGGKAKAELARRGLKPEPQQSEVEWWRQFEADLEGVDRAIEREHQAAIDNGLPWPPERKPSAATKPEPEHSQAEPELEMEPSPEPSAEPEAEPFSQFEELNSRSRKALERITEAKAEHEASAEYTARIEREHQAEPEAEPETADVEI